MGWRRQLPRIVADGCELGPGRDELKPCAYGDRGSHTTVVLFGDSHAGHWFDALSWISKRRHWRLVVMTKEGCTPAEVTLRARLGQRVLPWREKAKARIAGLHPALVIVSWARWMEPTASQKAGVPTGYGGPWQDGAAAIFQFLRRSAKQVIFISDTPYPEQSAADCVAGHLSDVRPCTRSTKRLNGPSVDQGGRASDRQAGAGQQHRPRPWFCAPKACPVIVGNILVYHDKSHMTPEWSRFIAPALDNAIQRAMYAAASESHRRCRSTATFRSFG